MSATVCQGAANSFRVRTESDQSIDAARSQARAVRKAFRSVCPVAASFGGRVPAHAAERQLCGDEFRAANVAQGSASDGQVCELTAVLLTPKLGGKIAASHGCWRPAICCQPLQSAMRQAIWHHQGRRSTKMSRNRWTTSVGFTGSQRTTVDHEGRDQGIDCGIWIPKGRKKWRLNRLSCQRRGRVRRGSPRRRARCPHLNAISTGISPCPFGNAPSDLPITAPKACSGSLAAIA